MCQLKEEQVTRSFFIRFQHPASGICEVSGGREKYRGKRQVFNGFPVRGMISDETYFLQSIPVYTVKAPGDTEDAIDRHSISAWDNSLFIQAGVGIQCRKYRKPDFAASRGRNSDGSIGPGKEFATGYRNKSCSRKTAGSQHSFWSGHGSVGKEPYFTGKQCKTTI